MKRMMTFGLFLLCLAASPLHAQSSARGSARFVMQDGLSKTVEFSASRDEKGKTTGSLTFSDEAKVPDSDDPEGSGDSFTLSLKAQLDDSTFEKNRAILSGTVLDSNHKTFIGQRVQFVLEDNGNDPKVPDQLTWMFCARSAGGWIPSDAELPYDDGAFLHWWATDAERDDDVGIPSVDLLPKEGVSCPVWPIWWYTFAELWKWEGDIIVES
ncbi:MAG: hypothetical protein ABUT39_00545 [Acidobacteriota bacterium]